MGSLYNARLMTRTIPDSRVKTPGSLTIENGTASAAAMIKANHRLPPGAIPSRKRIVLRV